MTARKPPKLRVVSQEQSPALKPGWYAAESGPIHSVDLARVDALIAKGVIGESQRADVEWIFSALTTAGGPEGGGFDVRLVTKLVELAGKPLPPQEDVHRKRVDVVSILRAYKDTGVWAVAFSVLGRLKRIDERFGTLTREVIDQHAAKDRSVLGFAARLTCECGAFGDRRRDKAKKAFEDAAREMSRKARPSRSKR